MQVLSVGRQGNPYLTNKACKDQTASQSGAEDIRAKKRMLAQAEQAKESTQNGPKVFQASSSQNMVNSMQAYTESLRTARSKSKDSNLAVKHVRYQAKAISGQIVRSKTSANCRQVVGKARREVVRLKRLRQNENYDAEELQSAITHAQAMERIAKKKLNHLLQEEMVHVEEETPSGKDEIASEEAYRMRETVDAEESEDGLEWAGEEWAEDIGDEFPENEWTSGNELAQLSEELLEEMQSWMEEMDLTELLGPPSTEMNEADFKEYQRKHRLAELKELAKADGEYLKARFEQLARQGAQGSMQGLGPSFGGDGMPSGVAAAYAAPAVSVGSVDIMA